MCKWKTLFNQFDLMGFGKQWFSNVFGHLEANHASPYHCKPIQFLSTTNHSVETGNKKSQVEHELH